MDSVKKVLTSYTRFMAKSKALLAFTLAVSLLLNLVLFLRIPQHSKPDIVQRYSEESFAALFEAVPRKRHVVGQTNTTVDHKRTKQLNPIRTSNQNEQATQKSACPRMTIHKDEVTPLPDTVCRPHLPAEDACAYAAKLFKLTPSVAKCRDQRDPPYELCRVTEIRNGRRLPAPEVKCDVSVCVKTADIRLLIVDPSDGNYLQLDLPGSISNNDIDEVVREAVVKMQANGYNILFIDCTHGKRKEKISQVLTFLPSEATFKPKGEASGKKVNVNVILLDSISRPHFFRSLRKTVSHLRQKSSEPRYPAHVFDFELFQSVHGHTHENEHALFGGTLYPENFTKNDKEAASTNMERLFGIFKDAGYQTMAQNDMCWRSTYGFMTSFMMEDWSELAKKMKETIDSTGVTETSCKILGSYDRTTSFNDNEDHQICYNGRHQHSYLFDHLTNYLRAVTTITPSKPLFSYTETNVAHDDVGIRVQTLDEDLVDLIDNVAQTPNTFTIIFADHGNTYTDYQISMLEGRLEMYHPILLGILPKELGRKFGEDVVENLRTNQYRLLHLFDLRESLVALSKYDTRSRLNQVGIFREISKDRTCDDLMLSTPNYCICEGWDIPVANSTAQVALAEFAIGQLNNQLQSALLASRGAEPVGESPVFFGACQRLRLQTIKNVRQRQTAKGTVVTTIDVQVQSGNIVDQEELITVQVESAQQPDSPSFDMRLATFNRISHYSIYEQCADHGVPVRLCICNKRNGETRHHNASVYDVLDKKSQVRKLKPCLLLIKRAYSENLGEEDFVGVEAYEVANICTDKQFSVRIGADMENVRSSTLLPIVVKLKPRSVYFASVMMTEVGYYEAKLKLKLRIVENDLQGGEAMDESEGKGGEGGTENDGKQNESRQAGERTAKRKVKNWGINEVYMEKSKTKRSGRRWQKLKEKSEKIEDDGRWKQA